MRLALAATILAFSSTSPALAGSCEGSASTLQQVDESVRRVERAWTSMDTASVQSEEARIRSLVACVDMPMTPQLAARVHRGLGLVAVTRGDQESAARAFAAARLASDEVQMTSTLAPPGSPVAKLYERPIQALPPIPLPGRPRGAILVDGRAVDELPAGRPLILQHLAREGTVLDSWWLTSAASAPEDPWLDSRKRTRTGLRIAGLAAIGLGGAAWGLAVASEAAHGRDVERTEAELVKLRDRSRAGTIAGAGLIVAGSAMVGVSWTRSFR